LVLNFDVTQFELGQDWRVYSYLAKLGRRVRGGKVVGR